MKHAELPTGRPPSRNAFLSATRLFACWALAALGTAPAVLAQVPAPTRTAVAGIAPVVFPTAIGGSPSSGSFEAGVAANSTWLMPIGFQLWVWTDPNGQSGIAGGGTGGVNAGTPPLGLNVAMLRGLGKVHHPLSLSGTTPLTAGTYRFRYRAAQRRQASGLDQQRLRVVLSNTTGSLEIDEHTIEVPGAQTASVTTYGQFVTRAFTIPAGPAIWTTVAFEGLDSSGQFTTFLDDIRLERLRTWNEVTSWSPQGVPNGNDEVLVPPGRTIAMTGTAVARSVNVQGQLVASDVACSMASTWVLVHQLGATFEVGRPDTPFLSTFTLSLKPRLVTEDVMGMGTAFLGSMDSGQIDLHGRPVVSWTRLAETVAPGSSGQIVVHGTATGWNVGDEIVVAGSVGQAFPTYVERTEARRITAVIGLNPALPGTTTFHTAPSGQAAGTFRELHHGAMTASMVTRTAGVPLQWSLEQRAEVGLLTHNIVITGDPLASPKIGAHVMMMRCPMCGSGRGGRGRFSNTEFRHVGHKQKLGRYPLHWHMQLDQGQGQFVKNCSVHHSLNRAITLHGSDYVTLEGNVAYDHLGHGIFLEDGSEQHNVIRGNLVMNTVRPISGDELLPSDNQFAQFQNQTPGMFWITNPNNIIEDNVATGSVGTGYWLIFPTELLGLSSTWSDPVLGLPLYQAYLQPLRITPPYKQPLGSFQRNLAHGCMSGFDVNDSIWKEAFSTFAKDSIRTNIGWEPPSPPALIEDFTAYGCDIGIYSGTSFDDQLTYHSVYGKHPFDFSRAVLADNVRNTMLASYVDLKGSLFMADTGKSIQTGASRLAFVYDGAFRFVDCHAVGYDAGGHTMLEVSGAATLHASNSIQGITRAPAGPLLFHIPDFTPPPPPPPPALPLPPALQVFPSKWGITVTDDGSATGSPGTIITNHPWMRLGVPGLETQLPGSGNAWRTPLQFGLVSAQFRPRALPAPIGWTGSLPAQITPVPRAIVRRLPHWAVPTTLSYLEDTDTTHHRGLTTIVDTPGLAWNFLYEYDWSVVPGMVGGPQGLPTAGHMSVTLDDRAPGDVAWISLRGIPPVARVFIDGVTDVHPGSPNPTLVTLVPALGGLGTATGTAAHIGANNVITLRLQITNAHRHETVSITWK